MVRVLAKGGKPLMPTNIKRARRLLRKGRAEIAGHDPFTIRLLDREDGETQPIEYKGGTGGHHTGIPRKSAQRRSSARNPSDHGLQEPCKPQTSRREHGPRAVK